MRTQQLSADDAAIKRYIEELWIPYNQELEATIDAFALADDADPVAEQVPWVHEKLESSDYRIHVAIDSSSETPLSDEEANLIGAEGDLVGFIATNKDTCPSVFDRPDRIVICEIYVSEPYRGTGLAHELVKYAESRAKAENCSEIVLSVDVDNNRALRFYDKLGFQSLRHRMVVNVSNLESRM